jgi:hypothetical protein
MTPGRAHQATILARYTDPTWHPLVQQTQVPAAAIDAIEPTWSGAANQDAMNASRSGLRTSACVVSMPCG